MSEEAKKLHGLQKVVRIGDEAPDFRTETQLGPLHFHEFIQNSWTILFSHPVRLFCHCLVLSQLPLIANRTFTGQFYAGVHN